MSTAILILNWNGKSDTLQCLASLQHLPAEIVVIDNGSTDGSADAIRVSFPNTTVLETGANLGYAGGNNVGIEYALGKGHEFIFLLNNDTIVSPDILKAFHEEAALHPQVGIFGARACRFSDPSKLDHLGGIWNPKKAAFDLIGFGESADFTYAGELDYVCGCSIFIRRTVFKKIGLLEPKFFLFWEEADFCMRAKRAGFEIGVCNPAHLLHKVSASFQGGKPHTAYFWWRSRFLWLSRNLAPKARLKIYGAPLAREIGKLYKHILLKKLQLLLSRTNQEQRKTKLLHYQAAIAGFHDYLWGKFGKGPSWIYTRRR